MVIKQAVTLKERILGLIGRKTAEPLLFTTRWGIHTFGVRFPIDVVVLDSEKRVVALKENLKPNRIFLWNPKYKNVLELPEGTIESENIKKDTTILVQTQ